MLAYIGCIQLVLRRQRFGDHCHPCFAPCTRRQQPAFLSWFLETLSLRCTLLLGVGITFSCMALIFNALAKGYDFFTYYFTLFLAPMMFLSGIFFPREQLPAFVRAIADWLPLSVAVDLVRLLYMDRRPEHALRHGLVLAVFAVVSFWIALALTRKRFRSWGAGLG